MYIYIFILIFLSFHLIKELFPKSRFLIFNLLLILSLFYFSLIKLDLYIFMTISFFIYFTFIIQKNLNYSIFPLFITFPLTLTIKTESKDLVFYQLFLFPCYISSTLEVF